MKVSKSGLIVKGSSLVVVRDLTMDPVVTGSVLKGVGVAQEARQKPPSLWTPEGSYGPLTASETRIYGGFSSSMFGANRAITVPSYPTCGSTAVRRHRLRPWSLNSLSHSTLSTS